MKELSYVKVLWVCLSLPPDRSRFDALANSVDLTVVGPDVDRGASPANGASESYRMITLTTVPPSSRRLAWMYRRLSHVIDDYQPDVIHLVCEPWGMAAVQLATLIGKRTPVLTLHTCDTMWFAPGFGPWPKQRLRRALARYSLSRVHGLASETDGAIAQSLLGGLRKSATTAVIHTNPRDPDTFRPPKNSGERRVDRAAIGVPMEGVGIGFLGRLVPEKGPLLLLEALRRSGILESGDPQPWAVIAGRGALAAEVAPVARSMGVQFLGSLDYETEVPRFYRSIDVFVAPSWRTEYWEDQSPRTIIEAQLSGCVVVGADSGAIPSMIGTSGLIVPEKDVDGLSAGLRRAVDLVGSDIGDEARASAIGRYSTATDSERLLAFWGLCVEQADTPPT